MNDLERERSLTAPFVSVIVPVRNEARFIAQTMDSALAQDYPSARFEIIVADGMSDDGTRDIMRYYGDRSTRITLVDNKERRTPDGLNAAIAASKGEIICRIDGHCEIAPDFISQCVKLLHEHPEAWVVGGPIVHAGTSLFGKAAAIAMSHPAGVGGATHRFSGYEGYVDTVQFPAFRRCVFDRVGLFDTRLLRTEDDELNYRVAQAGGRMFVSPRVRYVYYVRDNIGKLFRQYFQYSFWRIPVVRKHKRPTTFRQVVPPCFFLAMVLLILIGLLSAQPLIALMMPGFYIAAILLVGFSVIQSQGVRVASLVPVAIATMHLAYALGIGYGVWAALFDRRAWNPTGRMSALSR